MANKPFIAARIPEDLDQALRSYGEATGENRTEILINALSQYVGFTPNDQNKNKPTTKVNSLEDRMDQLEALVSRLQLLSSNVISDDNKSDNDAINLGELDDNPCEIIDTPLITIDNNSNTIGQGALFGLPSLERMTTKDLAEASGMNPNTVKAKGRKEQSVNHNGLEWIARKEGRSVVWVPKTIDNVNNTNNNEVAV